MQVPCMQTGEQTTAVVVFTVTIADVEIVAMLVEVKGWEEVAKVNGEELGRESAENECEVVEKVMEASGVFTVV